MNQLLMELQNIDLVAGAIGMCATFSSTLLRSFQNKNVASGFVKPAMLVGALMIISDGIVIALIAKGNWHVIGFSAIGSALGWATGMKLHALLLKNTISEKLKEEQDAIKRIAENASKKKVNKKVRKALRKEMSLYAREQKRIIESLKELEGEN